MGWYDGDGRRTEGYPSVKSPALDKSPIRDFPDFVSEENRVKGLEVVELVLHGENFVVAMGKIFQIKQLKDLSEATGLSIQQAKDFEQSILKVVSYMVLQEIKLILDQVNNLLAESSGDYVIYDLSLLIEKISKLESKTSYEFWEVETKNILQNSDQKYGRKFTEKLLKAFRDAGANHFAYYDKQGSLYFHPKKSKK